MITPNDFKNGMVIRYDGELLQILEFQHIKPGKGPAFVRAKLRNLRTGAIFERTFGNTSEKIEDVFVEQRPMQFLYRDGSSFVFMDQETYDQIPVDESIIGEQAKFLAEGTVCTLHLHEGSVLRVDLPKAVVLEVVETEPGVKGDTASGTAMKPARLETGVEVRVPLFIKVGDKIKVDSTTGEYLERASK